jgi:hypothetical protein
VSSLAGAKIAAIFAASIRLTDGSTTARWFTIRTANQWSVTAKSIESSRPSAAEILSVLKYPPETNWPLAMSGCESPGIQTFSLAILLACCCQESLMSGYQTSHRERSDLLASCRHRSSGQRSRRLEGESALEFHHAAGQPGLRSPAELRTVRERCRVEEADRCEIQVIKQVVKVRLQMD